MSASTEPYWSLFDVETVKVDMTAGSKREVLVELVDLLVDRGKLDGAEREQVLNALIEREKLGSTGIGSGVAIPHVKIDGFPRTVTAIGVAAGSVDFNAVDGEPCDVFFLLISPTSESQRHLEVLRWLSRLVRNPDFARFMRGSKTPAEAVGLLKEMSE